MGGISKLGTHNIEITAIQFIDQTTNFQDSLHVSDTTKHGRQRKSPPP